MTNVLIVKEIGTDRRLELRDVSEQQVGELELSPEEFERFCERLYKGFHGIPEKTS